MRISQLIKIVGEADDLLQIYGHAMNLKRDTGLIPIFALGLTALSGDAQKRIARQLALKEGSHGWSNVDDKDRRRYMRVWQRRKDEAEKWLKHYLGPTCVSNSNGVFKRALEELRRIS